MLEMKRHLAALASSDWDAFAADLAPDVSYEEVASRKRASGIAEYVEAVKVWKRAFPDLKATIKREFSAGDMIVTEVEWEGTHRGPLDTPFGTLPATGKTGRVSAVLIGRTKGDKLAEERHYFDQLTVLSQISAAPFATPTARGAEAAVH